MRKLGSGKTHISTFQQWKAGAVLVVIVSAMCFLAVRNPLEVAWVPPCPSHTLMGLSCPGCGSLRCTHHLLNARLLDAWRHNPAMILLGVPALLFLASSAAATLIGRPFPRFRVPASFAWIILTVLLIYTLARNLPLDALNSLRPPPP